METYLVYACLCVCLLVAKSHPQEPACLSKFDHDYKVLQKLVDLEHAQKEIAAKVAVLQSETKAHEKRCPNGWLRYESSCYLFVSDIKRTWEQGLAFCENVYSHLAAMETYNEQRFLTNALKQLKASSTYWIGASDEETDGTWVWQPDGPLLSEGGAKWAKGQPGGGKSQNCGCLYGGDDFRFHDHTCSTPEYIICEKDM